MPAVFGFGDKVLGNTLLGTFGAFGSFAMLLLVDFGGPIRDRVRNQAALALACGVLIVLATLVSRSPWLAGAMMAVIGFGVLFAGVASSVLAGATQTLLLSFILPVSLAGSASSIPDRLAGWGIASGCSLLAIALLWPAPASDPVRTGAIEGCRALAARLLGEPEAVERSDRAAQALHATFFATPFRPAGLSTAARAVVRLVDELRWLNSIDVQSADAEPDTAVRSTQEAVAHVLAAAADLIERPTGSAAPLDEARGTLRAELEVLERSTTRMMDEDGHADVSALNPGFRATEMSYIALQLGSNAAAAAAAARRTWWEKLLGRPPAGFPSTVAAAQERAVAHLQPHSVWLRNSLRGAAGLGIAILVAERSGAQHSFWIVLGTLSVLRSNALSTGQTIVRAIGGTAVGLVAGGTLVWLIGTNETLLWLVLPFAILMAGLAPAAVSFGAGQAAFTLTIFIIFNILQPAGWSLGLVRIEDVALGCAVSLLVGTLLWPRGAGAVLGRALASAYRDSAAYLAAAIAYAIGCCDHTTPRRERPEQDAVRAAAASRRLDDAFRGYVGERGAKPVPLAEVTSLVTGVVGLRLSADAVLELWDGDRSLATDRSATRRNLDAAARRTTAWYGVFADSLADGAAVPDALPANPSADAQLVATVRDELRDPDGATSATAIRVIWTSDHLDGARRLQANLVGPARAAVSAHALD
jgi:uncharacterized membrane protein YccC